MLRGTWLLMARAGTPPHAAIPQVTCSRIEAEHATSREGFGVATTVRQNADQCWKTSITQCTFHR